MAGKSEPVCIFEVLGLAGQLGDAAANLCATLAMGPEAYRLRDWETTAKGMRCCLQMSPYDGPANLSRQRIQELRHHPPVAN